MSHFTVAVVTTPDGDVVDALEPFYEFECSGIKNKGAVVDKVKYPSNPTVFRAVVLDSHS